ncbi:MAG: hypothetical protein JO316_09855 [Abitibacteriaceae bacterium]|nr:hypothetical protein [Abditibacteriaceae bacterium]
MVDGAALAHYNEGMSLWRRIALEQVPSCKHTIEQARNPNSLWYGLYDDLIEAYLEQPPNREKIGQIYEFALWCDKNKKRPYSSTHVVSFLGRIDDHERFDELDGFTHEDFQEFVKKLLTHRRSDIRY